MVRVDLKDLCVVSRPIGRQCSGGSRSLWPDLIFDTVRWSSSKDVDGKKSFVGVDWLVRFYQVYGDWRFSFLYHSFVCPFRTMVLHASEQPSCVSIPITCPKVQVHTKRMNS